MLPGLRSANTPRTYSVAADIHASFIAPLAALAQCLKRF